jgi:hypothetical protein
MYTGILCSSVETGGVTINADLSCSGSVTFFCFTMIGLNCFASLSRKQKFVAKISQNFVPFAVRNYAK